LEKEIAEQFCPICGDEVKPLLRYPQYLCKKCAGQAVSIDGKPLDFFNEGVGGGFLAFYSETKEKYDSHVCFVKNRKCFADEARFGGIVIQLMKLTQQEKITGGLVGMLVGDALGVPYEFHERESIPPFNEIEFEPPEYFQRSHSNVPPGTYSDDGAQALCLLASLLEKNKLDTDDLAKKIVAWYRTDYLAVDEVFDVGNQTLRAILNLRKGITPLEAGPNGEMKNGNGSLMRVLPLALWHQGTDRDLIIDAFLQSRITHGHLRSQICCAIYCLWARGILNETDHPFGEAVKTFREIFKEGTKERIELDTKICPEDLHNPEGSGYVVDSLFSSKWANNFENFEKVVKSSISLGNDTDTTACIAGGIAGLKFGIDAIPIRWKKNLRGKDIYLPLLEKLLNRTI
jgi:ADP-ribosylglycohydrolase